MREVLKWNPNHDQVKLIMILSVVVVVVVPVSRPYAMSE